MDPRHDRYLSPLAVTERLLWMPKPVSRGLVVNRPANGMSHAGRVFQARMWREYASTYDGRVLPRDGTIGIGQSWVANVMGKSRAECLRRARVNLYLARRLRRADH